MILSMILDIICEIAKFLFNLIITHIPGIDIGVQFANVLGIILSTTTQANNFIHFMLGDLAVIIVPQLILLITFKYIGYPIISFILSFTQLGRN